MDRFLSIIPQQASILDLGCGMGELTAKYMIEQGCILTDIDTSPTFINLCKNRFPNHTWLVTDMQNAVFGRTFDGILAWDSFFHLNHFNQRRMFLTFRRYAASGAALMFTSGTSHGEAMGEYQGEPLYHASLDTAEYRNLLDEQGFTVIDHMESDPLCGYRTVWLVKLD